MIIFRIQIDICERSYSIIDYGSGSGKDDIIIDFGGPRGLYMFQHNT
jgi:hypothetical protein